MNSVSKPSRTLATKIPTKSPAKALIAPPMRDGVSASCVHLPALNSAMQGGNQHLTIIDFLIEKFPQIPAEIWYTRLAQQKIYQDNGELVQRDTPYQANHKIYYYRELAYETAIPFTETILFQNEHLLVVDKPHFVPVSPTGRFVKQSVLVRLKQTLGNSQITPIHRLDRETAGVMLFSLQPATRHLYQNLFQNREVTKQYEAIAAYNPALMFPRSHQSRLVKGEPFFTMREIEGTANSLTRIELLEVKQQLARYRLHPVSGKQHQLRVHMAALGIPIVNDAFYPCVQPKDEADFRAPLQLLAQQIAFVDPITQQSVLYKSQQHLNF